MEDNKTCTQCNIKKPIIEFSKKYKTKDGTQKYSGYCKQCVNINDLKRREDKEYIKKKTEYDKKYYDKNRDIILEQKRKYHIENKEEILVKKKAYRSIEKNREHAKNYIKKYKKEHPDKYYEYRRKNPHIIAWRRLLYRTLTYLGKDKELNTITELGYTAIQLKEHLENNFKEGMTWDNFGDWEIDHTLPLTSFTSDSKPSEVNALSNLNPLWKEENRQKYNHII